MNVWQPDPGETLVARSPVAFATGAAPQVKGMRWFRDTERNDIQHELTGWPEGPSFAARSAGGAATHKTLKGVAKVAGVAVMALFSSAGGNVSGGGVASAENGSDVPEDAENEVDDFPVMWAAPSTVARTLPWQLDPGRVDKKQTCTHLVVTDRRLVVVQLPVYKKEPERMEDEVIWQCRLTEVAGVVPRNFKHGGDFTIAFVDGSWCRLESFRRRRLMRYLAPPRELIPLSSLPTQAQDTVNAFADEVRMPDSVAPNITRNPSGRLRAEILLPSRFTSDFGASETSITIEEDGRTVEIDDYLPDDF